MKNNTTIYNRGGRTFFLEVLFRSIPPPPPPLPPPLPPTPLEFSKILQYQKILCRMYILFHLSFVKQLNYCSKHTLVLALILYHIPSSVTQSFQQLFSTYIWLCEFGAKILYKKCTLKMLMKLTLEKPPIHDK